jgi:Sec-independent protein translocase protein TatA
MFDDIGKSNLVTFLILGLVSVMLPKLLPQMSPALGSAVKLVVDLLGESEAEAAEELMEALVSSTIAEINKEVSRPADPQQSRQAVERTVADFKRRARRRAQSWGANEHDGQRRYRRHLTKLREAVDRSKDQHLGAGRDILDDLGESLEETAY